MFLSGLSEWELGVLVSWGTDADWAHPAMTLRVPGSVARRLLADASDLSCSETGESDTVEQTAQETAQPFGPGVFDDVPVHARRPVTTGDLRALHAVSRDSDQLYLVMSLAAGPQVLPLSALEDGVAGGGRYVIIAVADDVPDTLVAASCAEFTEAEADNNPGSRSPVHEPGDPAFGRELGTAEGERLTVRLARSFHDPKAALRSLVLARNIADLRDLGDDWDRYESRRSPVHFSVWHGLLAMEQPDLRPFLPVSDDRWGGSGLPLGILAGVQVYSTDVTGRYEGRAHSPDCQHTQRGRGLSRYYDLATVEQMLDAERFDPCSKCGGYAIRRLTAAQVAYYRAAHQVHDLAGRVQWSTGNPSRPGVDFASLLAEVKKWVDTSADDWFEERREFREWNHFLHQLLRQVQTAAGGRTAQ
ncbi:hypothetical protein E5083_05350 [Streptomyces bauhiniae]|uniref:Uncharacterized protein n=1 Tax=Streptomyces bauhiniae TaxID=2340725 RepID=A0A4Z1D9Y4_9ACTN|nr:hypothetical protein [Streptomyces bauhiniae]TGN79086.1 hypothetical protein E5083_05350 [Streptomyces bauhiniae]